MPTIVSYGGGVNSTALLIGMHERGLPVDLVLFADVGGELPEVYRFVETFSAWLVAHGMPPVTTVKYATREGHALTLEENCLAIKALPSLAYGWKKCSLKFKVAPQDKFVNHWEPAREAWARGERVLKLIGYDAGETRRVEKAPREDAKYVKDYPLYNWGWKRADCIEAVRRAGLPPAAKSACFFCPASTVTDIRELRRDHPDLFERALHIEDNARENLTTVKGLGRRFSWRDLIPRLDREDALDVETIACECFDGGVGVEEDEKDFEIGVGR
jgi:hypothetical protein